MYVVTRIDRLLSKLKSLLRVGLVDFGRATVGHDFYRVATTGTLVVAVDRSGTCRVRRVVVRDPRRKPPDRRRVGFGDEKDIHFSGRPTRATEE